MRFKKILVMVMSFAMLIPSFAFADNSGDPFIKDLSKLRAKPYEWQFYDKNGEAIDRRIVRADIKMKALSARHVETHGVKVQPDGKEFVKDYFNDLDNKLKDMTIRIGDPKAYENTICAIKNQDVKYSSDKDKENIKKLYLKDLGLDDKVEFTDGWYFKEIFYICALPGSEIEITDIYVGGKLQDVSFKLKVNDDCSLSPIDNKTKVEGDVVNVYFGKKPANSDKPAVEDNKPVVDNNKPVDNNKLTDKPNVDKSNADKPVVDNSKPSDKVDNKTSTDKVDSEKPAAENKVSNDVSNEKLNDAGKRPSVVNNVPKTSDNSNIALYSMLLISSMGAISLILRRKLRVSK